MTDEEILITTENTDGEELDLESDNELVLESEPPPSSNLLVYSPDSELYLSKINDSVTTIVYLLIALLVVGVFKK